MRSLAEGHVIVDDEGANVAYGKSGRAPAPPPPSVLTAPNFDFRYTSKSGLNSDIAPCPFRARLGRQVTRKAWSAFPPDSDVAQRPTLLPARQSDWNMPRGACHDLRFIIGRVAS